MAVSPARILNADDPSALRQAAAVLDLGGLVAFPTETVYGLGADAGNEIAVARVFEVKNRPSIDPIIVHVASLDKAREYGDFPDPPTSLLAARFWPGPLTLVVPRRPSVPRIVTAGLDTVAVRVPAHPAALALLDIFGRGIAAPSANPFGYVSPTQAAHVFDQLGDQVDLILDGGPCPVGIESTVLSLSGPEPCILRKGGVTREELEAVLSTVTQAGHVAVVPSAPGQLARHYATRSPLSILVPGEPAAIPGPWERVGLVALQPPARPEGFSAVEILSHSGDLREAAARLFAALRRLDSLSLDRIVAYPLPERGLGAAIMDRLRRCAAGAGHPPEGPAGD